MEPITAAILGQVAGNLLGGLFGGRRRSSPVSTYNPAEAFSTEQMKLMRQLQEKALAEETENKLRYFQALPFLQTAVRSALRGLGFTEQGSDLGLRRMPFWGLLMRNAQEQADAIKANLIRRGLDPATAEAVAQNQKFRAEQEALAQSEAMNQQRLMQGVQLMGTLLGASQFNPQMLPQVLGSAQQAWGTAMQTALQQQQLQQQMKLAQMQQQQSLFNNIGSLLGFMASGGFKSFR